MSDDESCLDKVALSTLSDEVHSCQLCAGQLPDAPRPIVQLGWQAPILIAGQAPGRVARAAGKAFDDASGERLRAWLGVGREQFYNPRAFSILPMGFCFPGTGATGDLPPRRECAEHWRARLLAHHEKLALTLVIGRYAQQWHLGEGCTVTGAVARWQTYWPALLPLPHPSPRNNRWLARNAWFEKEVVPALQCRVRLLLERHL
ncbi:uracil-DNA glycosylase family protein [Simiduia sp. 21SJ11W-1]|uniref:uracil-DNA glycosylase family protein n=1 Tax=Simiduia sp. 21SJ11W-1 TaxID=2909669 RepID=UPI0020A0F699|nr:uracil-DNA glycosylase family protein [Simiduia sp. 21SJ11W-1]UTA47273.1 uracil-DNA glycosylase family protein [Simiduia sp. 21SJ11W-1]